ncbi:ribosomal-protein-alanine N-acetyltransferase [Anaerobranca californiensis DSM 14826]|jgi:ribosomal-protein-alanine N-acetyltransferase|uniref:[Ribosomal protein bS18]-alanine N-acetyltransferase n=1 Tax=Anaerobranca californiensis DSM 14826 TaxID=1120989 RepID=A0A1M6QSM8_9FIRM|nr:ribosomal protein S18-alanine N-acetyltransferase [Anaerobranca californiensis]SHK23123.1 ribosomal-protein-alanine N-acetyltransferase [Anaerobranca californiensis DSM 14826]
MYLVVPMEERHIPGILEIEKLSFHTPWSKEAFYQELKNHFAFYLVALDKDKVVGYIGSWIILDECHITNVAVHPQYRRLGIAKNLIKILKDTVKIKGVTGITLEVRVSNHSAQNLYKSLGFLEYGIRKGYYTDNNEDAVIMWLKI